SRIDENAAGIQKALLARAQTYAFAARYPEARDAFDALTPPSANEDLGVRDRIFRISLLADIQQGLGQHDQALAGISTALALVPDVSDEDQRIDHLAALHKQAGIVLRDAGRPQEALPHLRDAYGAVANMPTAYTAEVILVLVNTLLDLGLKDEARSLIDEGMTLASPRGNTSPTRGSFLQVRGRLALEAEDFAGAAADLEAAITMLRTGGDPYRTSLGSGYFNLGLVHMAQQRYPASVDCLRRARELEAAVYGADGGDVLLIEAELAQASFAAGDHEGASQAITRCLTLIRSGHPQARRRRNRVLGIAISIDLAHRWPAIYGTTAS
ncbi:tetratricopeptide repeat protein, partial [Actinoplanes palleronii]